VPMMPPKHRPLGWQPSSRRGSADPFYQSRAWREFRVLILERDRYQCTWVENGQRCTRRAVVVDHSVARRDGGADLDPSNCRSLCRQHDNQRHGEKGGAHG
jgi:5-methylcytosine-specific restriction endonuclease McrA